MEQYMKMTTLLVGALALAFTCGTAIAADKKPTKVRSTQSIECSKQADVKGLHGKERKAFRAKCKKDMASKPSKSKTASKKAA
jgi:hypothetical protein